MVGVWVSGYACSLSAFRLNGSIGSVVTRMVMLASVDKDAVCTVEAAGTDAAVAPSRETCDLVVFLQLRCFT